MMKRQKKKTASMHDWTMLQNDSDTQTVKNRFCRGNPIAWFLSYIDVHIYNT
jgi:hypothetical protein